MVVNDGMDVKKYAFIKFSVPSFAVMRGLYNPSKTLGFTFKNCCPRWMCF